MCRECNGPVPEPSRRSVLKGVGVALGGSGLGAVGLGTAAAWADGPDPALLTREPVVQPRAAWAGSSCPVRGALPAEAAGDVRFLLVHHTADPGNDYTAAQVPALLRGMYGYHVGSQKQWADLAYNFLVDRYGRIWEGRAGSLGAPVIPAATGGAQGYAQLGCFLGDHSTVPPTPQAQASMISLLAWLARRYGVDTSPGATTSFVSRGSNRWPAGTPVRTRTLEGHRSMSLTTCPGDAAYALVLDAFPAAVTRLNVVVDPARATTFVQQVYRDVLRREPEAAALAGWSTALAQGTSRGAVAAAVTAGAEYRSRLVGDAYTRYLGRAAEPGALSGWVAELGRGLTLQQLEAGILASPESYARAGGQDGGWVTHAYERALGRRPGVAELDGWVGDLRRDGDRTRVALALLLSTEHLRPLVEGCYRSLLRRPSDPGGRDGWVRALQGGTRQEQLVAGLVGSEEYFSQVGPI